MTFQRMRNGKELALLPPRAAIIEKLVLKGFLERKGSGKVKTLIPTEKGKALITVTPEQLQSPAMTADWEEKLSEVEHGEYAPETFMDEISGMIMELVNNYEIVKGAKVLMPGTTVIGTCPHCGAEVIERQKGWFCSNRECRFILWKDNAYFKKIGKRLTAQMAERLVRDGRIRVKDCKSQKTGKTYNASVLLSTEADGRPKFQLEFESGGGREMSAEKLEAVYLVDRQFFLHLKETESGFQYEAFHRSEKKEKLLRNADMGRPSGESNCLPAGSCAGSRL